MTEAKIIDCRGLSCPQPVLNTKQALEHASGSLLVLVDDEGACQNVRRFAESQGARVEVSEGEGEFRLTIEPGQQPPAREQPVITCSGKGPSSAKTVVYVSSAVMGRGDDELGGILMKAFLDTLSNFKEELSHVIFINGGVKLVVAGSPVLDQVRGLEQLGIEILACGTCLNHFGLTGKLAAGSVSNMYAIIETLSQAARIIRP